MVATENWIRHQFGILLACPYQHIVVTIPYDFRWMAKRCRKEVLGAMSRIAAEVIMEWAQERGFRPGIVSFFHSFGETLQFHPHYHILVTSGGLTPNGTWRTERAEFPGELLMRRYRAKMLAFFRELILSGKLKTKKSKWYYVKQLSVTELHWQFYVERITYNERAMLLYITRYVKRMIMSEKRIVSWNDKDVTFMTKSGKTLVYPMAMFIKCITQHIPDRYFPLIRYYGLYASACRQDYEKAKPFWGTLQKPVKRSTWRERQRTRLGYDPLWCCGQAMRLFQVNYPKSWAHLTWEKLLSANQIAYQQKLKWDDS